MNRWFPCVIAVLIAGVLGSAAPLSVAHSQECPPSEAQPPAANVDRFAGMWRNVNPDTDGVTRVEIRRRLNTLTVQMWGRCHPSDCDWGFEQTDVADSDDGLLSVAWNSGFKVETQQIALLPDGRLRVVGQARFTDNSGRPTMDYTQYFERPLR